MRVATGVGVVCLLGLAGIAANLGKKEIDAEGSVLVDEVRLELVNLLAQHLGSVADTTQDTHTAGIGDGRRELGAGGDVHAGEEDGVVDLEKISDLGADLFCLELGMSALDATKGEQP